MTAILYNESNKSILSANQISIIFFILIAAMPLGIALQNILMSGVLVYLILKCVQNRSRLGLLREAFRPELLSLLAAGYVFWMTIATLVNQNPNAYFNVKDPFGYVFWILAPILFGLLRIQIPSKKSRFLFSYFMTVLFIWGSICAWQYWGNWRIVGISIEENSSIRSQGFYSHPLSLAYSAVLLWPLVVNALLKSYRNIFCWLGFIGVASIILHSQSRMIQAASGVYLCLRLFWFSPASLRIFYTAGVLMLGIGVWNTDNFISNKFKKTLSEGGSDRFSSYPDDRLAFWHAHYLMAKEKPIIGHGFSVDNTYRFDYYKRIGLESFKKKYTAHNIYIQIVVNGGLVALCLFIAWIVSFMRLVQVFPQDSLPFISARDTIALFLLTSFTQNSFQDGCVRNTLMILVVLLMAQSLPRNTK